MTRIKFLPLYLLSWAPFPIIYGLSSLTYVLIYYVIRYRRKVVNNNLKTSFPEFDETEIKRLEKKFYAHFCDVWFEALKSLSMSQKQIQKRFRVKNVELLNSLHEQNRSAILYAAHVGNWEWMSFLPLFVKHQFTSFYQPLSNKYFDDFMKLVRSRFGTICVESDKGYKSMIQFERDELITLNCIIGDQRPKGKSTEHLVNFLGQNTAFLIGADKIAKKSGQAVLFPSFRKLKRGHYELEFQEIALAPKELEDMSIVDKYAQLIEECIRERPAHWLWTHKRWKVKG